MVRKLIRVQSKNGNFFHNFEQYVLWKWFEMVWNWKNHHLLTFVQIKTVSGVMRSCYLFLQVPMVMKKCLQTYYGIIIALEIFSRSLKSSVVIRKIVTFCIIWIILALKVVWKGMKLKKTPSPYVFANKTVPEVVRSCCLFLQVPMIMKKCLGTYYIIVLALENFYGTQIHQRSVTKQ